MKSTDLVLTYLSGDFADAVRNSTDLHFGLYNSLYEWFHPFYQEDEQNGFKTHKFVDVGSKENYIELASAFILWLILQVYLLKNLPICSTHFTY